MAVEKTQDVKTISAVAGILGELGELQDRREVMAFVTGPGAVMRAKAAVSVAKRLEALDDGARSRVEGFFKAHLSPAE